MSVIEKIKVAVARNPSAPAIISGEQVITYRHLAKLVQAATHQLLLQGISPGMSIGLAMTHGPAHCIAMLALARLGAITVPIDTAVSGAMKLGLCQRFALEAVVADRADIFIPEVRVICLTEITADRENSAQEVTDYQPEASTPLRVLLTSGTSGVPRGILYSHGTFLHRIEQGCYQLNEATRLIAPFLHTTLGPVLVTGTLCAGGVVIFPRSYDLPQLARTVNLYAATHLLLAPVNASRLVALLPGEGPAFPTLRHLRVFGSKPSPNLITQLMQRASPHVYVPYAMTEMSVISMSIPETLVSMPESAGKILPWARLEIVDDQNRILPAGEIGEIRVSSKGMPHGYYCCDDAAAQKFRDGWFYTGDLGKLSEEGWLFIEGRVDEQLNIGGHKVMPGYIEEVLVQYPQLHEAAVFMWQQADQEPVLALAAVVAPGLVEQKFAEFCLSRLGFLAPRLLFRLQTLPRNPMGKVLRNELPALVRNLQ
jgi:acyl-coenzyme A synthetase/AMP-(fatty) acid ligase